jgi:hypothetical protein
MIHHCVSGREAYLSRYTGGAFLAGIFGKTFFATIFFSKTTAAEQTQEHVFFLKAIVFF